MHVFGQAVLHGSTAFDSCLFIRIRLRTICYIVARLARQLGKLRYDVTDTCLVYETSERLNGILAVVLQSGQLCALWTHLSRTAHSVAPSL